MPEPPGARPPLADEAALETEALDDAEDALEANTLEAGLYYIAKGKGCKGSKSFYYTGKGGSKAFYYTGKGGSKSKGKGKAKHKSKEMLKNNSKARSKGMTKGKNKAQ